MASEKRTTNNLPPQSSFLYEANWTPAIDSLLVGTMIRPKRANDWDGSVFPSHFILEAEAVIEHELGYAFEWHELYDRLHFLEKRYMTFKELLQAEGTYWDAQNNTIVALDRVWTSILERNPLAGAYYHRGDPAYGELSELFAFNAVKAERDSTVIILSDSVELLGGKPLGGNEATHARDATSSEHGVHIRRKLVFEETIPNDQESTNNKGHTYVIVGANRKLEKVRPHDMAPRVPKKGVPPKSPTDTSSCASSSPIAWWRMPRKPT